MSAEPVGGGLRARAADDSGPEMIRVLSRLADDVEQFDSIVRNQRRELSSRPGGLRAFNDDQIRRRSKRISAAATEMALRVRDALDELQRMSEPPGLRLSDMREYHPGSRRSRDRQTG